MQPDEGRNAEVAREMKESGAWLVPTYNGLPYLDKPSFYFKTVALSFALFGETEMAARLSSALFGLALLVMTFAFCRREYGENAAALAVVVVATAPLYLAFSRLVIFDMTLTFFICGAVFAGYIAEQKQGRARAGWYVLGSAAAAVATLVKGPVGFILPTMVLGMFNLLDKNRGALMRFFAPLNLVVFFAITLPWFLGVNHLHPDFVYYGIIEESLHRFTTTQFRRTGPIYYYVPWIAAGFFPWSVLLPESAVDAWRTRKRWTSADRLFIVWAVAAAVFFSISKSKRPDYILSVIVALGALVGRVFASALQDRDGLAARVVRHSAVVLAALGLLGAGCLASAALNPHALEKSLKVEAGELDRVTALCTRLAIALLLAAAVAGIARWRRDVRALFAAFGLFPLALLTIGFDGIRLYANAKSSRALTDRLPALPALPARTEIVCLESFPTGLPFYRKQLVTVLTNDGDELTSNYIVFMLKKTKPWPLGVVPLEERDHWLASRDHPVLLLARRNAVDDLKSISANRSTPVTEFGLGWWGALLPAPGGP
jgi:4-amino-4-deoxy-L-arabinose transferase-like glycosyltransferase